MKKTNAARILDSLHISYEIKEYEVDENDLGAQHVAELVQMPVNQVFKTLVAKGDKQGILMAVVPGGAELNLKALATASQNKKVELVALKDVLPLTGYVRGGVSPLGAKKKYPVYIDDSCLVWPALSISAGQRGVQIFLAPQDLIRAVNGTVCPIARQEEKDADHNS
ncbi:MAG: Cys-tRNA(Pro) deacylase [Sporomusaceae bacterium]|nr:Cys-tRNA(Pro) deacylase [Sporomusaceae bacterium]